MLIYHHAYDAYHCVFRALALIDTLKVVELSKLRILDYFLCFPSKLSHVRLPTGHSDARKIWKAADTPYRGPVSYVQTFRDMEQIQLAAYKTLAASLLIEPDEFRTGLIRRTATPVPEELKKKIELMASDTPHLKYLAGKFSEIPLYGVNGLKARTGLMEYRYDVA